MKLKQYCFYAEFLEEMVQLLFGVGLINTFHYALPWQEFELDVLEEAYTTEHWIVRIYKVKDLENRGV